MAEDDRISLLPLEIKISVLSRLRVKDAVRTSALARSWRHLWTLLPRLHLNSFVDLLGLGLPRDSGSDPIWMERVVHLVSSLRGPILDFQLSYSCHDWQSAPLLQRLLDLLLQKGGVQTLELSNFNPGSPEVICLPCFHALKVLKLWRCRLVLPTGFPGFKCLTELVLVDTQISSGHINLLIHTSTNLTSSVHLSLIAAKDPLSVNISFPLLRCLQFCITDSLERASIISAPCLEKACIYFHSSLMNSTSEKLARITLELVTSVAMVSSLTLGSHSLKLLGNNSSHINGVAILMRELLAKKHDGFACLDQTVRSVTIDMYKLEATASIIMAQFFLLNAKVLKDLKVSYGTRAEVMPSMVEELQKVEIISSDAKVVIFNYITEKSYFV